MPDEKAYDSPVPKNIPTIRPARPKFSRPGISISRDLKREWREVRVDQVSVGDTVPGYGLIAAVSVLDGGLRWENVCGEETVISNHGTVKAFVVV